MSFTFLWHRLKLIMHKPWHVLIITIGAVALFFAIESLSYKTATEATIPIAFVDHNNSDDSKAIIARVEKRDPFRVRTVFSNDDAYELVAKRQVEAAFIIPQHFKASIENEQTEHLITVFESPSALTTGFIKEAVATEVLRLTTNAIAANDVSKRLFKDENQALWDEAWAYTDAQWEPSPLMTMTYDSQQDEQATSPSSFRHTLHLSLYAIAAFLTAFYLNDWLIIEKRRLMKRLTLSVPPFRYIIGNGLASVLILTVGGLALSVSIGLKGGLSWKEVSILAMMIVVYNVAVTAIALVSAAVLPFVQQLHFIGLLVTLLNSIALIFPIDGTSFLPVPAFLNGVRAAFISDPTMLLSSTVTLFISFSLALYILYLIMEGRYDYTS